MAVSHPPESTPVGALAALLANRVALLDGGLATALEAADLSLDDPLWSARALTDAPDLLVRVHRTFAEAGADVVCSASYYQASRQGFALRGLSADAADALIARSVELARQAAGGALVAASFGSYGAILHDGSEYTGAFAAPAPGLAAFHAERLNAARSARPDVVAFETVPSFEEVRAINDALVAADQPAGTAIISCTLSSDHHLGAGEPVTALADVA